MQSLCIKRGFSTINILLFAVALLLLLKFLCVTFFLCHPVILKTYILFYLFYIIFSKRRSHLKELQNYNQNFCVRHKNRQKHNQHFKPLFFKINLHFCHNVCQYLHLDIFSLCVHVIGTTCFDECFLFHVLSGRSLSLL